MKITPLFLRVSFWIFYINSLKNFKLIFGKIKCLRNTVLRKCIKFKFRFTHFVICHTKLRIKNFFFKEISLIELPTTLLCETYLYGDRSNRFVLFSLLLKKYWIYCQFIFITGGWGVSMFVGSQRWFGSWGRNFVVNVNSWTRATYESKE